MLNSGSASVTAILTDKQYECGFFEPFEVRTATFNPAANVR
jgi:type IV secretory pathway TraG/TraD family ATPase VirD4